MPIICWTGGLLLCLCLVALPLYLSGDSQSNELGRVQRITLTQTLAGDKKREEEEKPCDVGLEGAGLEESPKTINGMAVTTLSAWMRAAVSCEDVTHDWLAGKGSEITLLEEECSLQHAFANTTVPEFTSGSSDLSRIACDARETVAAAWWLLRLCSRVARDDQYSDTQFSMIEPTEEQISNLRRECLFRLLKDLDYEIESPAGIEQVCPHIWEL